MFGLVPNWWFDSGFRPDGSILASGWFDSTGVDGCAVEAELDEHHQRARQLVIDSQDQDCGCEADVRITSYPRFIGLGNDINVCAAKEGDCGSLEWKMDFAGTSTGWVAGGACHQFVAPPSLPDLPPNTDVTVSVRCTDCTDVADSVDITLVLCQLHVINNGGLVDGGSTFTMTAFGWPEGGTYDWDVISNPAMVTSLVANGPTATVTVRSSYIGSEYSPVVGVNFLVTYTTSDCTAWTLADAAIVLDSDGDGIPDNVETDAGCGREFSVDADNDGLTDTFEIDLGTDPCVSDSDGDTLGDGCEVQYNTDPLVFDDDFEVMKLRDTDHDGLSDYEEVFHCGSEGTDPLVWDTDGDGISDGCEVDGASSSDPLDPADPYDPEDPHSDPDFDNDGAPDAQERCSGTSVTNPDTDGDGILDGDELQYMTCCSRYRRLRCNRCLD